MQCYYCILMIKELKMIIKEPLWEDIIDWGIIEYDQTQYDDLRQHERLIHQISSTNTAIIFSMGTGGMGLQVTGTPHVDPFYVSERKTDTGECSDGPRDAPLFKDIKNLGDNQIVLSDIKNIFDGIPSRFQKDPLLDPDPEILELIINISKKYTDPSSAEYTFTYAYGMGISEENKYYYHGLEYCGVENCNGFGCLYPKNKKLAGKYLKLAALSRMLENGESPASVAKCYKGEGGALQALHDCVGFGIELTGRAEEYYNNNKHKLEGGK